MRYNITKPAANKGTIIKDSDGPEYVINTPINYYQESNTVVLQNCYPNLVLNKDNCQVAGVNPTDAVDIMTKLKAIDAFNPNV